MSFFYFAKTLFLLKTTYLETFLSQTCFLFKKSLKSNTKQTLILDSKKQNLNYFYFTTLRSNLRMFLKSDFTKKNIFMENLKFSTVEKVFLGQFFYLEKHFFSQKTTYLRTFLDRNNIKQTLNPKKNLVFKLFLFSNIKV